MSIFVNLAAMVAVVWIFIYTVSYGMWTWRKKNKPGAIMIFLVAMISVLLPAYILYSRI